MLVVVVVFDLQCWHMFVGRGVFGFEFFVVVKSIVCTWGTAWSLRGVIRDNECNVGPYYRGVCNGFDCIWRILLF